MENETTSAKPDYQATLKQKAADLYQVVQGSRPTDGAPAIYEALRQVALESWKNGIEAGRRKASKPAGSTKQS